MAYDSARGVTVLFGGITASGVELGDTWEWDGNIWTQRTPANSPSRRTHHAMVYDIAQGVTVLFGGLDSRWDRLSDTWEWDGNIWTQRTPANNPLPRADHAMAYDSTGGVVVLFGGHTNSGRNGETWEWNGTDWVLVSTTGPSARFLHAMTYDSTREVTVLFGGDDTGYTDRSNGETWEWSGAAWTMSVATDPWPRSYHAMAYDSLRSVTVLYGGWRTYPGGGGVDYETWEWDGTVWARKAIDGPPGYYVWDDNRGMVYDIARGVTVLFVNTGGTWEWDGNTWTPRTPASSPSPRSGHAMAYDSTRGVTVLFGGEFNGDETWEWDGTNWTQVSTAGPCARYRHSMAYDGNRRVTVLFGGRNYIMRFGDTWEWDGSTWTQRTPANSPSPRSSYAMAYDSARGVSVIYGGYNDDGYANETWEWDGSTWTQQTPVTTPLARIGHAMAYDSSRETTVLYGGATEGQEDYTSQTWEYGVPSDSANATNVHAVQVMGTRSVCVSFDLCSTDGAPAQISMMVSADGGLSFSIPPVSINGAIGGSVFPGSNREIVWDAGTDWPNQQSSEMRVQITAVHPTGTAASTSSSLFALDTRDIFTGTLTGRILDGATPIEGATITLEEPANLATMSQADGAFTLADVPVGTGYLLQVIAAGYEVVTVSGFDVVGGVQDLGDITLTPVTGTFVLRPLVPDINPAISEVEEDGFAYRYYLVRHASDPMSPADGVSVGVREEGGGISVSQAEATAHPGVAGKVAGVSDTGSGIVRLLIPAEAVGPAGSTKTFEPVIGDVAGPAFAVTVKPRSYEHVWEQETGASGEVGIKKYIKVGRNNGARTRLSREFGEESTAEVIERTDVAGNSAGVGIGIPGASAYLDDAQWGVSAGAGAGVYCEFLRTFAYQFDSASIDAWNAALRLYCLYFDLDMDNPWADQPALRPFLVYVRSVIEQALIGDVWRWSEMGFQLGGYAEADATLGFPQVGLLTPISGRSQLSAERGGLIRFKYDSAENQLDLQGGVVHSSSSTGNVAFGFTSSPLAGSLLPFATLLDQLCLKDPVTADVGREIEQFVSLRKPLSSSYPTEIALTTRIHMWGQSSVVACLEQRGLISGPDETVLQIEVSQPLTESEWQSIQPTADLLTELFGMEYATAAPVISATLGDELGRIFFSGRTYKQPMRYNYCVEQLDRESHPGGFEIPLLGISCEYILHKGLAFVSQEGIVSGGLLYPLWSMPTSGDIPPNDQSLIDIEGEWILAATGIFEDAWNRFVHTVLETGQTILQTATDIGEITVIAAQGTWPPGTTIAIDRWNPLTGEPQGQSLMAQGQMAEGGTINLLYGVGGMYRFIPDTDPSAPVTVTMTYQDDKVAGLDEASLRIYRLDDTNDLWELIGGTVDTAANTVTASTESLGVFALAPPLPTGKLTFQLSATLLPADGTSTATADASGLLLNNGAAMGDGWAYTVQATGMEIVSPDQDATHEGIQVLSSGGAISIEVRAPSSGGVGTFAVESVYGDAHGQGMIAFADSTPPPAVSGLTVAPGQSRLYLSWSAEGLPTDVSGYKVYYSENHVGPPFDGTAAVEGQPSPVSVAGGSVVLRGLNVSSIYYVAVSAVDSSGNEGPLSDTVAAVTVESPPAPPSEVRYEDDTAERYVIAWALSEDDGLNDRDVDHYEVYRGIVGSATRAKVADVPAGQALHTDASGALPPGSQVLYRVIAVDNVGLRSCPGDPAVPADCESDGDVDLVDFAEFSACFNGPNRPPLGGCTADVDFDDDGDVDLADSFVFSQCFNGPNRPPACLPPPCHTPAQDTDGDGDVDLADFAALSQCFNGPNRPWPAGADAEVCACLDRDSDLDIDLADFGVFSQCFNGPNRAPAAGCP
ncbi:MAG: carboxypeptidase regulatory-like domain-containing protein [Phycisphaerae bacterium]|nr:carboxypeptidase regulatory-like domain-containing protein [Phycisphaerae bacterium]